MIKVFSLIVLLVLPKICSANEKLDYEDPPKRYEDFFDEVKYQPMRVSAEFVGQIFPSHIHSIEIYDVGNSNLVGSITSTSENIEGRWTVNEDYGHNSSWIQLGFKVIAENASDIYKIPVILDKGKNLSRFKAKTLCSIQDGNDVYLAAGRILFSGNLNASGRLRASLSCKYTLVGNLSERTFASIRQDVYIPEGSPENDPDIFKGLVSDASLVNERYESISLLGFEQRKFLNIIEKNMIKYICEAKNKYSNIDLFKLSCAFSQQGYFRSNLTLFFANKVKKTILQKEELSELRAIIGYLNVNE